MRAVVWIFGVLLFVIAAWLVYDGASGLQRIVVEQGPPGLRVWREDFWFGDGVTQGARAVLSVFGGVLGALYGYRALMIAGRMG
ncbi:MAG: hypothetical protein AABZ30_00165 [Myxococcota bacterium]